MDDLVEKRGDGGIVGNDGRLDASTKRKEASDLSVYASMPWVILPVPFTHYSAIVPSAAGTFTEPPLRTSDNERTPTDSQQALTRQ